MALVAMAGKDTPKNSGIAMHYGFIPDTYMMLPVAERGGVSLEWFRRSCMANTDYDKMNAALVQRKPNDLLFLPYPETKYRRFCKLYDLSMEIGYII